MSVETDETTAKPDSGSDGKELLKNALDSHQAITLRALDVIPPDQRFLVYMLWTLSALGGVAGLAFAFLGSLPLGFSIIVLSFVGILAGLFILNRPSITSPEQLGRLAAGQVSGPTWSRVVPKQPLPDDDVGQYQIQLRQLRTLAVAKVNEARAKTKAPDIKSEHVRLNVFLVSIERVRKYGEVCGLFIPPRLQDNMSQFKDRNIRFRPHEGITGRTFTLGEACGAKATPGEEDELTWGRVDVFPQRPGSDEWLEFSLSEEQKALIEPGLRWIVSFPLQYEGQGADGTFGILNIDGLIDDLSTDEMRYLAENIEPSVNAFAADLADLPRVRIAIRVEEIK